MDTALAAADRSSLAWLPQLSVVLLMHSVFATLRAGLYCAVACLEACQGLKACTF